MDAQLFNPQRRSGDLRRKSSAAPRDTLALYVARVASEKNVELGVTAFRAKQRFSGAVRLVMVGVGPLHSKLQRQHPDPTFEGLRRGERLAACYASADIFLLPSETETFGNVVLEAMAGGLAVVAYDYAAARMHLTCGEPGLPVPYVDAAVRLVENASLRERIRRQAGAHAAALDRQEVANRFAALLTGATHDPHRRCHNPDLKPTSSYGGLALLLTPVVLVGWSRLYLKRHTLPQVLAGGMLSWTIFLALLPRQNISHTPVAPAAGRNPLDLALPPFARCPHGGNPLS